MQHPHEYNMTFCQSFSLNLDPLASENECARTLILHVQPHYVMLVTPGEVLILFLTYSIRFRK